MPDFADHLAAFLATLELGPAHVAGLSFGGTLALELWRRHPHACARPAEPEVTATLFAAPSIPDPDGTFAASVAASRPTGIATMGHALAESDLVPIPLSRASYRKMLKNLGWAAGYNVLVIPLAAGVHARAGLTLSPAVGTILKSASTITVALNAQTLRRVDLPQPLAA